MSSFRRGRAPDMGMAGLITASANQLWSAGLGALTMAEREGLRFFDHMARLGQRDDEARERERAERPAMPASALERLEEIVEQRVSRTLNALQIPTARDVQELGERVEALSRAVDELAGRSASAPDAAPVVRPARKTATRKKPAKPARRVARKKAGTAARAVPRKKTGAAARPAPRKKAARSAGTATGTKTTARKRPTAKKKPAVRKKATAKGRRTSTRTASRGRGRD